MARHYFLGHAIGVTGASAATICPSGTHAPTRGSTLCLSCPASHYQPYEGKGSCLPCPDGAEAEEGGVSCSCLAGFAAAALSGRNWHLSTRIIRRVSECSFLSTCID